MDIIKKGNLYYVPCSPEIPTIRTSAGERAIGRLLRAILTDQPKSQAEADLVGDALFMMFRRNAETIEEAPPSRAVNKALLDWTLSTPEFQNAKESAANNLVVSLASAGVLWSSFTTSDALKEALEFQNKAAEEEEQADDWDDVADELEQEADDAAQNGLTETEREKSEQAAAARQMAQEKRESAKAIAKQGTDRMDKLSKNSLAQGMISQAAKQAADKGKKAEAFMKGWGIEPGDLTVEGAQDVLKLVEDTSKSMQSLAELIGRLQGIASTTSERVKAGYVGSVSEPTTTTDINHLFPTERAYLSRAAPAYIRAKYVARMFAGGGLLGWKPKFQGKKKGSFVALVDRSGSMQGSDLTNAKAIALGIARALAMDNSLTERMYRMTYFQSNVERDLSVTNEDGWEKHVAWAKVNVEGGTNFDDALMYAIEIVKEFKDRGVSGADILFITDGACYMSNETAQAILDLKEEIGTRMITVRIGHDYGYTDRNKLKELSNMYITTSSLKDDADSLVAQITENIVRADMG